MPHQLLQAHRLFSLLLWSALFGFPLTSAWAQEPVAERIALVIGNSKYGFGALTNPVNDAKAMTTLLRDAGFQVDEVLDANQQGLKKAVAQFGKNVQAETVKLAVFYYAGHGIQLDWRNYLIPVDARLRSPDDVRKQSTDVSDLLRYMQETKNRSFLVILDACRDNPFEGGNIASGKGLSQFDAPVGSMIAFSTSPGNVAQDGDGKNGLYTGHLLREFSVRNARVEDAFKRVRLNVRVESGGKQIPWESTSLEDDLYLFPIVKKKLSEAEQELQFEKEVNAWLRVKSATQTDPLIAFLREYPSGNTSELAQARLNRLLLAQSHSKAQQEALAEAARVKEAQELLLAQQQQAELRAQEVKAQQAKAEAVRLRQEQQALELAQAREREAQAQLAELQRKKEAQLKLDVQLANEREAARLEEDRRRAAMAEAARMKAAEIAQTQAQAERLKQQRLNALKEQEAKDQQAKAEAERLRQEQQRQELAAARARDTQLQWEAAQRQKELQLQREAQLAQDREEMRKRDELQRAAQAEVARLAAEKASELAAREAQKVARMVEETKAASKAAALAAAKQKVQIASLQTANLLTVAATPYYKGMDVHMRNYTVGDIYTTRVVDMFNKSEKPVVFKVTNVDLLADRVEYNDGEYASDLMGNIAKNVRGSMDAPRQFYPSELYLGKKWRTHFRQVRPGGQIYTFDYNVKVVAKETITVPAGTYEAYRIEAFGFNMELQAAIQRKIWVTPGINADIAHETHVRLRNGKVDQWDRQELVSYKALAAALATN